MYSTKRSSGIPSLTTDQIREVDRAMIEDYKISLVQMMENAGRNLANLARLKFLDGDPRGKSVIVMAGSGGNGGGAIVSARHLHNMGAFITILPTKDPDQFSPVPKKQIEIIHHMGLKIQNTITLDDLENSNLIIDGLIGYSLVGYPRGYTRELIVVANSQPTPILALDTPSGLDTTSGYARNPTIGARATMTLALPKKGLLAKAAGRYVGELFLADISVPPQLYKRAPINIDVDNIFAKSEILLLT